MSLDLYHEVDTGLSPTPLPISYLHDRKEESCLWDKEYSLW